MTRIIVDQWLRDKLIKLSEPVELCDESGRVLGRLFPSADLSQYGPLEPQVSEEELDRRDNAQDKRYTTTEVLATWRNSRSSFESYTGVCHCLLAPVRVTTS